MTPFHARALLSVRALLATLLVLTGVAFTPVHPATAQGSDIPIDVEAGVAGQDVEFITEGLQLALDFFTDDVGAEFDIDFDVRVEEGAAENASSLLAYWDGDSIVVLTGSLSWQHAAPAERIATVIHELTHVYQTSIMGFHDVSSPAWFEEGIAEYLSYHVLDQLGIVDHGELIAIDLSISALYLRNLLLNDISTWQDFQQAGADGYPLAHAAVSTLMDKLPLSVVGLYYSMLSQGYAIDQVFSMLFGTTPSLFSDDMSAHLSTWTMPDGLSPHDLMLVPVERTSPVELIDAPPIVTAGEQFLVLGLTEPASVCALDIMVPGATAPIVERSTFADGSGDLFWLVTIPPDLADGLVTIEAACGGAGDSRAAVLH